MPHYIEREIHQCVPLDYQQANYAHITLFARDIYQEGQEQAEVLVFLNGGPGFSCVREWRHSAWLIEALKTYRVLLVDQRGTGRSQAVGLHTLEAFSLNQDLAEYLTHFRADNIVRDVEFLRAQVLKKTKITLLGQSFGGFVALSYLSLAPQSLSRVFITAGMAPVLCTSVEQVYQALAKTVLERNQHFYRRYPEDQAKVQAIVVALKKQPLCLSGESLTLSRFLDLGWYLGQEEGFETLHAVLDEAFTDEKMSQLTWRFGKTVLEMTSFWEKNPLYVLLHESIYCQGFASAWAADRVKQAWPAFDLTQELPCFSGEMVRRGMLEDYVGLQPFKTVAELLAQKSDWPKLYDRQVLAANTVPIDALLMQQDFYVDHGLACEVIQWMPTLTVWHHPTWQHDALRKHGQPIMRAWLGRQAPPKP